MKKYKPKITKFKKMEKTSKMLTIAIIATLIAIQTMAQNCYVKVNAGYGLPAGTQTTYSRDFVEDPYLETIDVVKYSYGSGINFTGAFGVMFNKNFGAELGVGYLIGSKIETVDNWAAVYSTTKTTITDKSKMIFFVPALIIESGFEKINPYARIGILIAKPSISATLNSTNTSTLPTKKTVRVTETKMDLGLGANAALGIMYNLSEKFAIFGECNINSLSITPKSSKLTEYTIDGADQLSSMTTIEKETVYENSYTDDNITPSPEGEPAKSLKFKMPFSSIGANFGVKISF